MTVADLIRVAFRSIGVLAAEETPSAAEEADAFGTLNAMLDSWAAEHLTLYATLRSTYTLTPSLQPHTLGVGGTFNATRPVRIERASIIPVGAPGAERPLRLLTDAEWQASQGKTTVAAPFSLWLDTTYPLLSLYLWPIPVAADTLVLYAWQQLGRFAATSDTFDMPPGYERALRSNLAVELAPDYGMSVSAELGNIANDSKANLKRLNVQPSRLRADPAMLSGGGRLNLISGDR